MRFLRGRSCKRAGPSAVTGRARDPCLVLWHSDMAFRHGIQSMYVSLSSRLPVLYHLLLLWLLTGPPAPGAPETSDAPPACRAEDPGAILIDDADAHRVEVTAYWTRWTAAQAPGLHGATVRSDGGVGVDGVVRFYPLVERAGRFAVYLYWPPLREGRLATNASVDVRHAAGGTTRTVDQQAHAGRWLRLGAFRFTPGRAAHVAVRNDAADGIVLADAVLFCPEPEP